MNPFSGVIQRGHLWLLLSGHRLDSLAGKGYACLLSSDKITPVSSCPRKGHVNGACGMGTCGWGQKHRCILARASWSWSSTCILRTGSFRSVHDPNDRSVTTFGRDGMDGPWMDEWNLDYTTTTSIVQASHRPTRSEPHSPHTLWDPTRLRRQQELSVARTSSMSSLLHQTAIVTRARHSDTKSTAGSPPPAGTGSNHTTLQSTVQLSAQNRIATFSRPWCTGVSRTLQKL
ncbi:hypothetical protein B0J13DRAFT_308129 [Dactylonectria estremocensis]|uniref:Uncharacterized protein n=1 Tax=Dactylonectria estremocensis TaxID=1079267 RepID=A0A9P9J8P3_9HYPO|nr:hypothetical protein B0J13DRAFT_308129 [Dactylonectria estremocensis]